MPDFTSVTPDSMAVLAAVVKLIPGWPMAQQDSAMSANGFIRHRRMYDLLRPPVGSASFTADRWQSPDKAPFGRALPVRVTDGQSEYTLPFPCVRTESGWVHADKGSQLQVQVVGWRWSDRTHHAPNALGKVFF